MIELWIDVLKMRLSQEFDVDDAIRDASEAMDAFKKQFFCEDDCLPCCTEEETRVCWTGEAKRSPYREVCSYDSGSIIEVTDDDDEDEEWVERVFVGFYCSDEGEVAYACHDALQAGLVQLWDNARILA